MKLVLLIAAVLCCFFVNSLSVVDLNTEFQNMLTQHQLMGMAVEIAKNGTTIYKGNFGLRDYDRKLPVDNNTMFRMASLSKSIATCGLMLLYE
jgi:CubicO group peptidase (beta-lactamase class C family)